MAAIDLSMGVRVVRVSETTDVSHARRSASAAALELGFTEEQAGRVALVATEAATNILRHGGGGEVLVGALRLAAGTAVEIIALDKGPGMADVRRSMRDGYSTAGSSGTGLGAMERLAGGLEIHSQPGKGTALVARIFGGPGERRAGGRPTPDEVEAGGVAVPVRGEELCGDAWNARALPGSLKILVADGLGHGPAAAEASRRAAEVFAEYADRDGPELMQRMHAALRPTRGASVAVARLCPHEKVVEFTGVGNISGSVVASGGEIRQMVSHPGTVGHGVRRIHQFTYPWPAGAIVVMHSDGLATHWTFDGYRDLLEHSVTLIAAVLYRDFSRGRDDATAVVARRRA